MAVQYFLGANSSIGFCSHYDELQPGLQRLRILKGGPGCGKSTLMKRVAAEAERLGLGAERILCSSDPESLDGVVIPALRYGVVDGTAPHIVEPKLCGCGALYLDLGRGYDPDALSLRQKTLTELQAAGSACYPRATALLQAAAALEPILQTRCENVLTQALATSLCDKELPDKKETAGRLRRIFLSGHTPKGRLCCWETVEALCPRVYVLKSAGAQVTEFLRTIAQVALARGWDVLLCDSALLPGVQLEDLLIPGLGLGFVSSTPSLPYPGSCSRVLGSLCGAEDLLAMQAQLTKEALACIGSAKEYHDLLESGMAPFVDFTAADDAASLCCREVRALWEAQKA